MQIRALNPDFSVSDQLRPEDLAALAARGVKSLIVNRPDKEAGDQPAFAELAAEAGRLGLTIHHLPVVHDKINGEDVNHFEALYQDAPKPLHAFCRSGLRSLTLYSLMRVRQGDALTRVVAEANAAGYDFANFADKFASVLAAYPDQAKGRD